MYSVSIIAEMLFKNIKDFMDSIEATDLQSCEIRIHTGNTI